jgi:ribonuclease BN (tRNA processing enzyme)
MRNVDHVFLTHSHLDHVAALPLMVDAVAARRKQALQIHALAGTIAALKAHIFNDVIWPDFSRIPTPQAPFISFHEIQTGQTLQINRKLLEVLPAVHTVPAVGYAVTAGTGCWVFSGDTERNPAFWERVNQLNVAMLVIETAFSNREKDLAKLSLHLSPMVLARSWTASPRAQNFPDLHHPHQAGRNRPDHGRDPEVRPDQSVSGPNVTHDIRWLRAGQEFDL